MSACKEIDALMIDWLYGELDESHRAPFDDHLAGCARCRSELESLEETREAMRELPELEPPAAVSAILLHEAAKRAPAPVRARAVIPVEDSAGQGLFGWLADLFRPVLQHPAATAVATLVLVAGVAGSLYLRGGHKVAQPMAAGGEAAPAREAEPSVETKPVGSTVSFDPAKQGAVDEPLDGRRLSDRSYEVQLADEGDFDFRSNLSEKNQKSLDDGLARQAEIGLGLANSEGVTGKEQPQKPAANSAPMRERNTKAPGRAGSGGTPVGAPMDFAANAVSGADPLVDLEEESFDAPTVTVTPNADKQVLDQTATGSVAGGARDGYAADDAKYAQPPEPRPVEKRDESKSKKPAAKRGIAKDARAVPNAPAPPPASGSPYRVYRDPKQELAWAKTESRKLSKALSSQRCRDAARIANDILDRNPDYFYKTVSGSKSIKRCQWYVNNEQERRSRTRTKARAQRRPSPKKTTGQASQPAEDAMEPVSE